MSKLTEFFTRVMEDPHEEQEVKDELEAYLKKVNEDLEKALKREAYWGTYCEQQFNDYKRQLESQKKWYENGLKFERCSAVFGLVVSGLMGSAVTVWVMRWVG